MTNSAFIGTITHENIHENCQILIRRYWKTFFILIWAILTNYIQIAVKKIVTRYQSLVGLSNRKWKDKLFLVPQTVTVQCRLWPIEALNLCCFNIQVTGTSFLVGIFLLTVKKLMLWPVLGLISVFSQWKWSALVNLCTCNEFHIVNSTYILNEVKLIYSKWFNLVKCFDVALTGFLQG